MKTLILYDNNGKIYLEVSGTYSVPQGGIQFIETEIPIGKILKGIDVSVTPNAPIFEDIPKTEIELLKEQIDSLTQANAELTGIVAIIDKPTA